MSFNKAIQFGKEHRKPYKGSKAFDHSCRNHGSCPYCSSNRQINKTRALLYTQQDIKEYWYNLLYYIGYEV